MNDEFSCAALLLKEILEVGQRTPVVNQLRRVAVKEWNGFKRTQMSGMPRAKDSEKALLKDKTDRDMAMGDIAAQRRCV